MAAVIELHGVGKTYASGALSVEALRGIDLTIDSGEAIDRYQWFLRGYLAAVEKEEIAIATITHHHSDHSGNLKWAKEFLKADVTIPANGRPLLKGRPLR